MMLEKKPNARRIHQMRIIDLIEADFNLALKRYYNKHIMPNAEEIGLSSSQWGGRKNRSAPACAMRKVIAWEHSRYTKTILASFFGDLKACFDRMIWELSSYVSRKKGMSKNSAKCRALVIALAIRTVRTAFGISTQSFCEEEDNFPCQGELQGKGDTMALWTLFSNILLQCHEEHCHGLVMEDVTRTIKTRRSTNA